MANFSICLNEIIRKEGVRAKQDALLGSLDIIAAERKINSLLFLALKEPEIIKKRRQKPDPQSSNKEAKGTFGRNTEGL